jgi:hypothetical protein
VIVLATCLPTRETGVLAGKEMLYRGFTFKSAQMRRGATTSINFDRTQLGFRLV